MVLAGFTAALIFTTAASADTKTSSTVDTTSDPLVTLSYINDVLKPQLTAEIMADVTALFGSSGTLPDSMSNFEVVYLSAGQTLTASQPLELILRSGECIAAVTSPANISNGVGLSDLTAGTEVTNGQAVQRNHYIIISRADGRGIVITSSEAYIMVRGEYIIGRQ
jgi:hypothetical protein